MLGLRYLAARAGVCDRGRWRGIWGIRRYTSLVCTRGGVQGCVDTVLEHTGARVGAPPGQGIYIGIWPSAGASKCCI